MVRRGPEQEQGTLRPRGTTDASGRRITPRNSTAAGDAPRPRVCRRHRLGKPILGNRMSEPTPRAGLPLVLLAGNHEQDTHWLGSILESAGYAVLREPTGRYVLERARTTEPDAIIMEADLPDIPGVELCRLLRADPRLSSRAGELASQAFRDHSALACVVLALDVEGPAPPTSHGATNVIVRCVHRLKASARLSDVVGRLSPTEFAVLALGTDASDARRLAERLASSVQAGPSSPGEPAEQLQTPLGVRCGYEAVANVGYTPIEPVDLLVRASTALRTGRVEGGGWLRRFDAGGSPAL